MFLLQSECFACIQIVKTVGDKNGIPVGMIMMMIKQSITLIPVIIKMVDIHVIYIYRYLIAPKYLETLPIFF